MAVPEGGGDPCPGKPGQPERPSCGNPEQGRLRRGSARRRSRLKLPSAANGGGATAFILHASFRPCASASTMAMPTEKSFPDTATSGKDVPVPFSGWRKWPTLIHEFAGKGACKIRAYFHGACPACLFRKQAAAWNGLEWMKEEDRRAAGNSRWCAPHPGLSAAWPAHRLVPSRPGACFRSSVSPGSAVPGRRDRSGPKRGRNSAPGPAAARSCSPEVFDAYRAGP